MGFEGCRWLRRGCEGKEAGESEWNECQELNPARTTLTP